MELSSLRIFKEVAEQGGISRAADRLHRVQSNVTTRIKQLEDQLGVTLFHRQGRRIVLTSEGQVLLGYAEKLLQMSAEAQTAVKDGKPRGTFRIGSLESTAAARLPPVLAEYHAKYPDIRLDIGTGTTGALIARVLDQDIEAALVAEPFAFDGLQTLPVFQEELVLITSALHASVRRAADLGHVTLIAFPAGCSYRRRLETWLGKRGTVSERVIEVASYHAIVACVAAGMGVGIIPRSVLALTPAHDSVAVHALAQAVGKARTHLVWRQGHNSPALTTFAECLQRHGRAQIH